MQKMLQKSIRIRVFKIKRHFTIKRHFVLKMKMGRSLNWSFDCILIFENMFELVNLPNIPSSNKITKNVEALQI